MSNILGYPTKTAAVLALRKQGLRISEIARRLGISPNAASGLESSAKRFKRPAETRAVTASHSTDIVPPDLRRQFRPHAARRGVSVDLLIHDLLTAIADSDLVDAVLDDAGDAA